MKYSLAPMEGIITSTFRSAYFNHFNEADEYYTPFLTSPGLGKKELNEILPETNPAGPLIPQILTNNSETFISICDTLKKYDYDTVNLNLGCPSGTVVSKKRGAGFLRYPEELERFLSEIFEGSDMNISVKTRIGFDDSEEWPEILNIFNRFPIKELIIHPRTRQEYYSETIHPEAFAYALANSDIPICYNGDITDSESMERLLQTFPSVEHVMIGRGVLKNPGLIGELKGNGSCDRLKIKMFHDELFIKYKEIMSGEKPVLFKMKELWSYLAVSFPEYPDCRKKIHKTKNLKEYVDITSSIFADVCT